jgi:hypothetical protein
MTVKDLKEMIGREKRKYADVNRQEIRLEPRGKFLKDETTIRELDLQTGAMLYFKVRRRILKLMVLNDSRKRLMFRIEVTRLAGQPCF